jgi:hypothetical protein
MRKAWTGFLVAALAAASTTPLCSSSSFAQQLPAQAAAAQSAPEAAAPQSAQEPAGQAAANCPGHPDALGTSRVLALDPTEYVRIGRMQYPDSLALNDKEVVLTFDDGPLLPYSNQILDVLASQCVKATYFLIGEMARAFPATVRRIYEEGHTIGTHSEDHPTRFAVSTLLQNAPEMLHCALIHIHMQIAKMKDYESIKRLRNFGQPDVVVPHFDLGGVSATAPI